MSYFKTPPEGDAPQGHEAEQATVQTPAPYWAQYADEAAAWDDDGAAWDEEPDADRCGRVRLRAAAGRCPAERVRDPGARRSGRP